MHAGYCFLQAVDVFGHSVSAVCVLGIGQIVFDADPATDCATKLATPAAETWTLRLLETQGVSLFTPGVQAVALLQAAQFFDQDYNLSRPISGGPQVN